MSVSKEMYIPKTITVGYQSRKDTYTKRLAYVIYTDSKGVLRKEKSWQTWRTKTLGKDDYENVPRSGFVLNKKVGGESNGWNHRNTFVRVFDPHGFEFEISVPNLIFILEETSSIQGKGLEGEFVYAWDGTELVLLPTCSKEYKDCMRFTEVQGKKISKGEIKEGNIYLLKDMSKVLYLGKHDFLAPIYSWSSDELKPVGKRHIFLKMGKVDRGEPKYLGLSGFANVKELVLEDYAEYADSYQKFKNSKFHDVVKDVKLTKLSPVSTDNGTVCIMKEKESYFIARIGRKNYGTSALVFTRGDEVNLKPKTGIITLPKAPERPYYSDHAEIVTNQTFYALHYVTEKGEKYSVTKNIY